MEAWDAGLPFLGGIAGPGDSRMFCVKKTHRCTAPGSRPPGLWICLHKSPGPPPGNPWEGGGPGRVWDVGERASGLGCSLYKGTSTGPMENGSGTGPIVGATVSVAVLRQVQVCRPAPSRSGFRVLGFGFRSLGLRVSDVGV